MSKVNKLFVVQCRGKGISDLFMPVPTAEKALKRWRDGLDKPLADEYEADPSFRVRELSMEDFLAMTPHEFTLNDDGAI